MKLSHKQAKSSTGLWKANECLKLDAPEVAKLNIPLLSLPSYTQLVSFFWTSTKALLWKGTGMIIFLRWMPKIFFFQLPIVNKYSLGVELAPAQQVIKKLKMDHLCVYTLCPTPCCNGYRRWWKPKRACQLLKFWIYVLDREIHIFWKFHVKISFDQKL